MTFKDRNEKIELTVVLLTIVTIIVLIFAVGFFGVIYTDTFKIPPVPQSETPVLDKIRSDVEKIKM